MLLMLWTFAKAETSKSGGLGIGVTLCLAAVADGGKSIIGLSDYMISAPAFSADNLALKERIIHVGSNKFLITGLVWLRSANCAERPCTHLGESL
jgi:hypothetical protein